MSDLKKIIGQTCMDLAEGLETGSFGKKPVNSGITGEGAQLSLRKARICSQGEHDPLDPDVFRGEVFLFPGIRVNVLTIPRPYGTS